MRKGTIVPTEGQNKAADEWQIHPLCLGWVTHLPPSDTDTSGSRVLRDGLGWGHFPGPTRLAYSAMLSVKLTQTLSLAMCRIRGNQKIGRLMSKGRPGK